MKPMCHLQVVSLQYLITLLTVCCVSLVSSQNTYNVLSTGNWNDPSIWDVYPGTTIEPGDNVEVGGHFEVTIDDTINNYGTITIYYGPGKIINNGTIFNYNEILNNGFISNRITGVIDNHSIITNRRLDTYGEIINRATFNIENSFTNIGMFTNDTFGLINNSGSLTNNAEGQFVNNNRIDNHASIFNYGIFTTNVRINNWVYTQIVNYSGDFINNGILDGDGSIINISALLNEGNIYTLNFNNSGYFTNNDTFFVTGGTFTNTGTIMGRNAGHSGYFENVGILSPGTSPGIYEINSDYNHTSTATLEIELSGMGAPGIGYDQVIIDADAVVAGTLNVTFLNNFNPQAGTTFTILTANNITGAFTTLNFPSLTDKQVNITYNSDAIILTVNSTLSIEDTDELSEMTLYPNPVVDELHINGNSSNISQIDVYTINGHLLRTQKYHDNNHITIDLSAFTSGMYLVKLLTDTGSIFKRILK